MELFCTSVMVLLLNSYSTEGEFYVIRHVRLFLFQKFLNFCEGKKWFSCYKVVVLYYILCQFSLVKTACKEHDCRRKQTMTWKSMAAESEISQFINWSFAQFNISLLFLINLQWHECNIANLIINFCLFFSQLVGLKFTLWTTYRTKKKLSLFSIQDIKNTTCLGPCTIEKKNVKFTCPV